MSSLDEKMLSNILDFISSHQQEEGRSPSFRAIQSHVKATSLSVVHRYVNELKARGLIAKEDSGSIYIDPRLASKGTVSVPMLGDVSCGSPILAIENIEASFPLPLELFRGKDLFMLRAKGLSMIDVGIHDGDVLVIKKQSFADRGDIVLALVGEEATVKRYRVEKGRSVLRAENKGMPELVFYDFKILGKVVSYIHKF